MIFTLTPKTPCLNMTCRVACSIKSFPGCPVCIINPSLNFIDLARAALNLPLMTTSTPFAPLSITFRRTLYAALLTANPSSSLYFNASHWAPAHNPRFDTRSANSSKLSSGNPNLFCTKEVSSFNRLPFSPKISWDLVALIIISVFCEVTLTSTPANPSAANSLAKNSFNSA
eukprot:NODE_768_length_4387_cov_0.301772.p3 type:complete len:172 gc:universal NODE_768_length_4387_cov_0.301772:475-990(+)